MKRRFLVINQTAENPFRVLLVGTEISLGIGGLSIDGSKNSRGNDHGPLFQEGDCKPVRSDEIDYDYFAENGEAPGLIKMSLVRRLKDVVPRIELLGFTLDTARAQYLGAVAACREERGDLDEEGAGAEALPDLMSFEEFCAFSTAHPVQSLDDTFINSLDEKQIHGRFSDERVTGRIPRLLDGWPAYSERSYFGGLIGILHPYALLRVLAESPDNLEADLVWQYGPWSRPAGRAKANSLRAPKHPDLPDRHRREFGRPHHSPCLLGPATRDRRLLPLHRRE